MPTTWYDEHTHCPDCVRDSHLIYDEYIYVDGFNDTEMMCTFCGWKGRISDCVESGRPKFKVWWLFRKLIRKNKI